MKNKIILHLSDFSQVELLPFNLQVMAHLITYDVPEGYTIVYKSRNCRQGIKITHSQLSILQQCVLNDEQAPEFTNTIKSEDSTKKVKKDKLKDIYINRLNTLENDMFNITYYDESIGDRIKFIEQELGIISNDEISLDRLEKCEFWFKNMVYRVNKLEESIFNTSEKVHCMRAVLTFEGRLYRLERALKISFDFNLNCLERLYKIEKYVA